MGIPWVVPWVYRDIPMTPATLTAVEHLEHGLEDLVNLHLRQRVHRIEVGQTPHVPKLGPRLGVGHILPIDLEHRELPERERPRRFERRPVLELHPVVFERDVPDAQRDPARRPFFGVVLGIPAKVMDATVPEIGATEVFAERCGVSAGTLRVSTAYKGLGVRGTWCDGGVRIAGRVGGSAAAKLAPAHRAVPAVVYDARLLNMVRQVGVAGASEFGEAVWALSLNI